MDTEVLIVGAGPVGLTLALDLGRRGVRCMLDRAQGRTAAPAEDGALQRAQHGDVSPHGVGRTLPRGRTAGRCADGRVHRHVAGRSAAAPPALSFGRRDEAADRSMQRRHAAARALSAHLAIHRRAAAEIGGRCRSQRYGALRLRVCVVHPGRAKRHRRDQERTRQDRAHHRAISGRLRWRRQRRAQATRHRPAGRRQHPAASPGTLPLRRTVRAHLDRQGPPLSRRRHASDAAHPAGRHAAFHAAFGRGKG